MMYESVYLNYIRHMIHYFYSPDIIHLRLIEDCYREAALNGW